ncbi:MAG: phosphotransferase [Actinomycetota bacterium]|nr:phosphotransferase [Actinomycetota bacterium]MDA8208508.1 phosphotransferase [Actinomycetota bacterium]
MTGARALEAAIEALFAGAGPERRWLPTQARLERALVTTVLGGPERGVALAELTFSQGCFRAAFAFDAAGGGAPVVREVFEPDFDQGLVDMLRALAFAGPRSDEVAAALVKGSAEPIFLDQSNSAFLIGDGGFGKFYRRCGDVSREAQFYHHLAGSGVAASFWGEFSYPDGSVAALVTERLEDPRSAWEIAGSLLDEGDLQGTAKLVRECGRALGEMHDRLEDSWPESSTVGHDRLSRWLEDRLALHLEALGPGEGFGLAATELRALVAGLEGPFPCSHIHGDFHLGQLVRSSDALVIIDFEGEPEAGAGPMELAERDLAGLLRSIGYLAPADSDDGLRQLLRSAALEGYATSRVGGEMLSLPERVALLALFETEKALYELAYETRFRPEMAAGPAIALERLAWRLDGLAGTASQAPGSLTALVRREYAR